MGNLAPQTVPADSTDSRTHRRQLATAVNSILKKLFAPSAVLINAPAGDASQQVTAAGNPVLIVGFIKATSSASVVSLKRGAPTIATWGNSDPAQNIPIAWLDTPGTGIFTYSTDSGGHTSASSLSVVELK